MFLRNVFFILLFTIIVIPAFSQPRSEYKQYRILILLDGSSSMVQQWNEKDSRFQIASHIITRLMDSVYHFNPDVEFALRVYGHQHGVPENNCFDTRREVAFSKDNYTQMDLRLEALHPIGVSPIAYSLKVAAEEDFNDSYNYAYSLVLITDGGESCGGDICEVVKSLLARKIEFKPYIISLVDYAPLKDQYACLGNYLLAADPTQMSKAIGTIAEEYRRVFKVPVLKTLPEDTLPKKPVVKPVVITPVVTQPEVKHEKIDQLPSSEKPIAVSEKMNKPTLPKKEIATTPLPNKEEEPKPAASAPVISKEKITAVKTNQRYILLPKNDIKPAPPQRRAVARVALPVKEEEPVAVLKKEEIARMHTNKALRNFGLFWSTPSLNKRTIPLTPIPPKEVTPVVASANTKPAPVRTAVQKAVLPHTGKTDEIKQASYTIKTEPDAQTSLEIYFTDGKGKFYQTSPPITLVDTKTGKEVKKFYRTVDANGNPDPQILSAGTFTMLIGKKENFVAKAVTILPNNKNKITIIATNGNLSFKYTDNYKTPMNEFTALVKKNFEPGPVITQPAATNRDYEVGNYHIELNTLPISRRNLDIEFGTDYIIEIDEPGYVSVLNTDNLGKATLYYQNGDMFSKFYTLDINGNPALQKVRLQPGAYQIRFKDNGVFQSTLEKTISFFVKSRETTELYLK